jgi:hypothetical protein
MDMKSETEPEPEPATQSSSAALESDLGDIRALLRQAVAIGNNANKSTESRLAAMTAATRLFCAAAKGSEMIARLQGHVPQTRHTTVVQHDEQPPGPAEGQSYDAWWNSLGAKKQAQIERRVNAVAEKFRPLVLAERAQERAEREAALGRGDPSEENPKTTAGDPQSDDAGDRQRDDPGTEEA